MFFFPGVTKCQICSQPILHRYEATFLPYIHPSVTEKSLFKLARSFVHRKCWEDWELANLYSKAAYDLVVSERNSQGSSGLIFTSSLLTICKFINPQEYQLEDFKLMAEIRFQQSDLTEFLDFWIFVFSLSSHEFEYQKAQRHFKAEPHQLGIQFSEFYLDNIEPYNIFVVPFERYSDWLKALQLIKKEFLRE
jgi:hypothetical protein